MRKLQIVLFVISTVLLLVSGSVAQEKQSDIKNDTTESDIKQKETTNPDQTKIIAYYFHGDQRCATCIKLENYAREAIESGFEKMIADSTIVFTMINYDKEENEHYIDDYKLYTKALILSKVSDGKEVEWKNLDKIWQLVRDKDKYIEYVQSETEAFINETAK